MLVPGGQLRLHVDSRALYHGQLQTPNTYNKTERFCLIVSEHEFFMIAISVLVIVIPYTALRTLCLPPFSSYWVSRWLLVPYFGWGVFSKQSVLLVTVHPHDDQTLSFICLPSLAKGASLRALVIDKIRNETHQDCKLDAQLYGSTIISKM